MGMLFSAQATLSPLVGRCWVPVYAGTELFKCQRETRPPHLLSSPVRMLKCHSPHEAINFVFVCAASIAFVIDLSNQRQSIILHFKLFYCYRFQVVIGYSNEWMNDSVTQVSHNYWKFCITVHLRFACFIHFWIR